MQAQSSIFKETALAAFKVTALAAAIGYASALSAAEWTLEPSLQIQTAHDSNIRLTPDAQDGVLANNAIAALKAKRRTETSDISLSGGYTLSKYNNAAENVRDRDQQFAQGILRKKWSRWGMGASAGVRRDDLLRIIREDGIDSGSELGAGSGAGPLPGEAPEDDLVPGSAADEFALSEQVRRTLWRAAAYGQYEVTERDRLRLGYSYAKRDYSAGDLAINIRDSERNAIDLQYARDLTERTVLTTTVSIAELQTTGRPNSDFYQALIGWRSRFNERSRIELGLGGSKVKSDEDSSTGFLIRIRGTLLAGTGKLTGELRRSLIPNAFGNVAEADTIKIKYTRPISERISLGFDLNGLRRERGSDDDRSERDQVRTAVNTSWAFAPQWALGASYDYSWIKRKGEQLTNTGTAKGHRGTLSLTWTPRTIRIGQ